jgi:uncharacterized membrane protein
MRWSVVWVLGWCATALAGGGTGGRIGGGNWSSHSSAPPSHSFTPSYSPPSHGSTPTYTHTDTSSFGSTSHASWSPSPTPVYGSTDASTYGSTASSGIGGATYAPPLFDVPLHEDHFFPDLLPWVIGIGVVMLGMYLWQRHEDAPLSMGDDGPALAETDLSVLRIAIDGRARKFVQSELARIAKVADTGTDQGRVTMLREVALTLRRLRDGWVYGGAINEAMDDLEHQKVRFDHHVDDARVRFREETISNVQGVTSRIAASEATPRSDQGAGLALVSIIVAARRELYTVGEIGSGHDLSTALEALGTLDPFALIAVEIVWQPSEDNDRMSSIELEARYPRPQLIPIQGALVGRTFCGFCSAPFPAELVSCPHCGAPAPARERHVG